MNKQILVPALGVILLASCADRFDQNFETVRPDKEAQYGYLEKYDALKEYAKDNPNFHLGIGTNAADYNKKELVYALTNSNFTETVAGNAMKMGSCVSDDGSMDFETVVNYVNNATDAGLSVYGHVLAWHSQQANKWLNSLLADKELPPAEENPGLIVESGDPKENTWDYEIYYDLDEPLKAGQTYDIALNVRGTNPGTIDFWPGKKDGTKTQYGAGSFTIGTSAVNNSFSFTPNADIDRMRFCFGKVGGTLYFDNFVLKEHGSDTNLAVNSTFDEEDISHWTKESWVNISYKRGNVAVASVDIPETVGKLTFDDGSKLGGWGMDHTPTNVDGVCQVGNDAAKANSWSAQVNYEPGFTFENGKTYYLKMKIKGSVDGTFGAGLQNPDGYKGCGDFSPSISVTTDWKEVVVSTTCSGDNALRLLLNIGQYPGMLYIDDFEVYIMKKGNSLPLTDKEKKDTLTYAMDKWIGGIMEATQGKVKAWDVVNESLSGADKDGDGKYELQSATRGNVSEEDAKNCFYWQDYLGDLDYVRTAVALARKHFAANGGNADELKLFINDFNLEWDDNKKLKSLIKWIQDWEADGVTKIDGIGSQMHISCYGNAQTQEKKKNAIVNMLKLIAESGKICRISELDMGYVDANGNKVATSEMTEAQHKEMRDLYEFVVKKYLEIIPAAQQWGICQWCATDSSSGWRAGEPVGLWDVDYYRKHAYAGFAAGLGAPEYWNDAAE